MATDWRNSREYRAWRAAVIRRDKVCQCCGSIKDRHAHHKKHATYFVELRFVPENGVTLCGGCHSVLHNKLAGGYRMKCGDEHFTRLLAVRDYFSFTENEGKSATG